MKWEAYKTSAPECCVSSPSYNYVCSGIFLLFGSLKYIWEMEIVVFVLVFSNLNLVLAGDNVAVDNSDSSKDNRQAHAAQESNDFLNDQLAESSQSIAQPYGNAVEGDNHRESHVDTQQLPEGPTSVEHAIQLPDGLRSDAATLNQVQILHQGLHHGYVQPQQTHPLYFRYPEQQIRITGVEASPLQQTRDIAGSQPLGYSTYVEHLSEKDEEDIKSAMKDGSVSDIKRLVPKSGISFKIYQNGKNPEKQIPPTPTHPPPHFSLKTPAELSVLHHRTRGELHVPSLGQAEVYQTSVEELEQSALQNENGEERRGSEYSQQLLQSLGQKQQPDLNAHTVHYTQSGSHKTLSEINEKGSSTAKPHFRINVAESNYNKQATAPELHRNQKSSTKSSKHSFSASTSQKHWNLNGQTPGYPQPGKIFEALHYPVASLQIQDSKGPSYTRSHGSNALGYKPDSSFVETAKHDSRSYHSDSYIAKTSQKTFLGQFANAAHSDQKVAFSPLSGGGVEGTKPGYSVHNKVTSAYSDDAFKTGPFATFDNEATKPGQHNLFTSTPKSSYVQTKSIHNFDHQKALQGSTPFDIKNAIDGTGSLVHQTNTLAPTSTDIHPLHNSHEKPFTYIIPKIPTSALVIDNSLQDAVPDAPQIKHFAHTPPRASPPLLPYHTAAEIGGKFYNPSQTFLWTSDYIQHGNALASKDLHQQLLRLHLPKELYIKTPNGEFPVSAVSHISQALQKQPASFHYDLPFIKSFQELHVPPKTKTQVQYSPVSHFKPGQAVAVDWSLFKSDSGNLDISQLAIKPESVSHVQESGKKKIVPILVRRRKNRSNSQQEVGVVYGKVNANRRPKNPNQRREKSIRGNLLQEASNSVQQLDEREERKNEFSVSASYKVDRSSSSS